MSGLKLPRPHPTWLAVLAPFVLFAPIYLTGKAIYWGTPALQFHPWRVFAWEALRAGELPLWNPLSGMGAPLLANYQSALLYPPNWVYFALAAAGGEPWMAWGMAPLAAAHLALAGWGMSRLARELGLGATAQAVSGLAFGLSGYLVARAHFLSMNAAAAWLPWILWAAYRLATRPDQRREAFRLALLAALLLLAGHAQLAWYTLLLAGAWAVFWAAVELRGSVPGGGRQFVRVLGWFALAMLLGVALAAIQLLPTAELLAQSSRAGGADYDFVMTYSFWPWRLTGWLAPGLFGSPATGDYWGYGNFWEDAVYVGLLPFLLALRGLFARRKLASGRFSGLVVFLGGVTLLALLLALGQNTPVFPFLYRHVPTFDLFQAPARFSIWAVFALALLAGLGAEAWPAFSAQTRSRQERGIVVALGIVLAAGAARVWLPGLEPTFLRATAWAGVLGLGAAALARWVPRGAARFPWWVGGLAAVDLVIAGWGLNPGVGLEFYRETPASAREARRLLEDGRLFLLPQDEYRLAFEQFLRFDTFETDAAALRASLLPNLNLLDRLPSANNFDPLRPARYVSWLEELEAAPEARQRAWLAMMAVAVWETVDAEGGPRFQPFPGGPRFQWLPCAWPVADGRQAWDVLVQPLAFDRPFVVVEGYAPSGGWVCGEGGEGEVSVLSETPNEIRLQVTADSSGWLLVADSWYPGWRAEVNGQAAVVYRANYLFRAVEVPAGGGEVMLRYAPGWLYAGAGISAAGLVALVLLGGYFRKSSRTTMFR